MYLKFHIFVKNCFLVFDRTSCEQFKWLFFYAKSWKLTQNNLLYSSLPVAVCFTDRVVCLHHVDNLCKCPPSKYCLRYRYTLDELPAMMYRLKTRAECYDNWNKAVKEALDASDENKLGKNCWHRNGRHLLNQNWSHLWWLYMCFSVLWDLWKKSQL